MFHAVELNSAFGECMTSVDMAQDREMRSFTVGELFAPSGWPTEVQGTGLDGVRFEGIRVD